MDNLQDILADKLYKVRKSGIVYRSECPICKSTKSTPFILFENANYMCHKCGESGSPQKLISEVFKLDINNFKEELKNFKPHFEDVGFTVKDVDYKVEAQHFSQKVKENKERAFELLFDLIPKDTKYIDFKKLNKFIGYDDYNDTLAIFLHHQNKVVNVKRRKVGKIKWLGMSGSDGKFAPTRLTGQRVVYIASGIGEFLLLHASKLDYIVAQSDGGKVNHLIPSGVIAVVLEDNDKEKITKDEHKKYVCKFDNNLFNPFIKKMTDFITARKIVINFEELVNCELEKGYDLRDFVKDFPNHWLNFIEKEVDNKLKVLEDKIVDEIVTDYKGDYIPDITHIQRGVIKARTGAGKTHGFINRPNTLILVPRVEQSTESGLENDFLIDKIINKGAIVTYNKFMGHYGILHFRKFIESESIQVIVDEAHILLALPSTMHRTIYNLDALFLSGTIEKFFRNDLQHYKYKPQNSITLYRADAIPKIKGSLVFIDNAKAIMHNYPKNFIVSKTKSDNSVNVHTTTKDYVFSTSAIREGVSVNNDNFKACIVDKINCSMWSLKDIIQGLNRPRGKEVKRILIGDIPSSYDKKIDFDWWVEFANKASNEVQINSIMGEFYSKFIKTTHSTNQYIEADNYGVACYLAHLTKDNIDKDFYIFEEYSEDNEFYKINTDTKGIIDGDEEKSTYKTKDGIKWEFDTKDKSKFLKWVKQYESGFIGRLMKLKDFKNFGEVYAKSSTAREVKKEYNKTSKLRKKKYSINMFYSLLKDLVELEIIDENGSKIEKLGTVKSLKNISIKIVGNCAIKSAKKQ